MAKYSIKLSCAIALVLLFVLVLTATACQHTAERELILLTTTSTRDSGLLGSILPDFESRTDIHVKVVAIGTGAALQNGRDGNGDVLLVHAKKDEERFVDNGHGTARYNVMYNDFIIVGPKRDPLQIKTLYSHDPLRALQTIYDNNLTFISRGDDSGTHKRELSLWSQAGYDLRQNFFDWYKSTGKGMGETLTMASEMQAYTLVDRATYLNMKDELDLSIIVQRNDALFNQYGVIAVNPAKNDHIHGAEANVFIDWILSQRVQQKIGDYGVAQYGEALFIPNARN